MVQTEQKILESIRALTPETRKRVIRAAALENDKPARKSRMSEEELELRKVRFRKAQEWIENNKEKYDGQFVLLEGDVLIGHGDNPKELYRLADDRGIKSPFVERIKAFELPFGGW